MEAHVRHRFRLSAPEVDDVIQDVVLELMRYEEPVRDSEGLVFRILHLRTLQLLRRRGVRREEPIEDDLRTAEDLPIQGPDADVRILLRQTLAQTTPACRRLIRAHYLEGKTLKETAEALSYASLNVVWTLLDRCIRRLRSVLGVTR
ncbi:MAG: sigma-70 family RNA polymerase sigma factor [Holophagales bacterium]|jgi:RNA polymerase sigma factor (sigma-70 family)|nr:sigma-70 family RNA polymerase sigma factor [Holophagales bacterium]MBK9964456.1 sigma-70 family RNA polymerase sigma factor [Holophagales bacterium]